MKQRICHITSVHPANDTRIYHKECISLAKNGYEVYLIAKGKLPIQIKNIIHKVLPEFSNRARLARMFLRSWSAYRLAKSTGARIYHIHDPELLPFALLLKWQGYFVIYDVHEDVPRDIMTKEWIPSRFKKGLAWLIERLEHFIARRIDGVIASTPFICQRFQIIQKYSVEVKNYPKLNELCFENSTIFLNDEIPAVCYIGLLSLQRGVVEMIQAVEFLSVRLIIAGAFNNSSTEKIVRALPGWSKVDFRGLVSREEIANILATSKLGLCVLHASITHINSLPIKLFEYMSAKLPVLASRFSLWQSIVESTSCGLCVDPMNVIELRQAIKWLLNHPEAAKKMGENGYAAVKATYHWEAEEQVLLSIYDSLSNRI